MAEPILVFNIEAFISDSIADLEKELAATEDKWQRNQVLGQIEALKTALALSKAAETGADS